MYLNIKSYIQLRANLTTAKIRHTALHAARSAHPPGAEDLADAVDHVAGNVANAAGDARHAVGDVVGHGAHHVGHAAHRTAQRVHDVVHLNDQQQREQDSRR